MASVFKVLQSCDARWFAGKSYVTDHSSSAVSSRHKAFAVVCRDQVRSVQNKISKSALHRLVCIIASLFRNKL